MYLLTLANILKKNFGKIIYGTILVNQNSLSLNLKKEYLNYFLYFLKNSNFFNFRALLDIFGVDILGKSDKHRFIVYYILFNKKLGLSLTVKIYTNLNDIVLTITNHFNGAGWLEREVYDMFGIYFYKNEDMRRILTDYGFEGFPLRKDFPLTGFVELQYSEEEKVVVSNPTKVGQALRLFHFSNVWDLVKKN